MIAQFSNAELSKMQIKLSPIFTLYLWCEVHALNAATSVSFSYGWIHSEPPEQVCSRHQAEVMIQKTNSTSSKSLFEIDY